VTGHLKKLKYVLPKGDPVKFAIIFCLMMGAAVLEVAGIGMIPAFVAIIADPQRVLESQLLQPLFGLLGISDRESLLLWGAIALVLIFLLKSLYTIAFNYFEARFIYRRLYLIERRLMTSYMEAPYTFYLQRNTAELLRNITGEVRVVVKLILTKLLTMTKQVVISLFILIFLFVVEPLITVIVMVISVFGAGTFIALTKKKVKSYGAEELGRRERKIKAVNQGLGGMKEARVLNREKEFIERFNLESRRSSQLMAHIKFIMQLPKPVVETTAVIGMLLISALMVWQGRPMEAIIPVLTLFAMATVRLMPSIQQISSDYTNLQYNLVSLEPVYNDLCELEQYGLRLRADRRNSSKLSFETMIEARGLSYFYPESSEQVIKRVSFQIPKGSAVAFVGESGAGKTTMVDLILGLLEPRSGEILVDGKNIQSCLSAWQQNIGYIPQSIYLADESLRQNVAFGIPENEIDDEKVWRALRLAQLEKMVTRLPEGIHTFIGENGTRISGGQRQRVGIARALYHDPQVLVMDEATSALDNVTEKEITMAIESLKGDRTIIMIAHRLTTVMNCDQLYLMEAGEIIQEGTYQNLLDNSSVFKRMALEHS